jgi:hypothetical protein
MNLRSAASSTTTGRTINPNQASAWLTPELAWMTAPEILGRAPVISELLAQVAVAVASLSPADREQALKFPMLTGSADSIKEALKSNPESVSRWVGAFQIGLQQALAAVSSARVISGTSIRIGVAPVLNPEDVSQQLDQAYALLLRWENAPAPLRDWLAHTRIVWAAPSFFDGVAGPAGWTILKCPFRNTHQAGAALLHEAMHHVVKAVWPFERSAGSKTKEPAGRRSLHEASSLLMDALFVLDGSRQGLFSLDQVEREYADHELRTGKQALATLQRSLRKRRLPADAAAFAETLTREVRHLVRHVPNPARPAAKSGLWEQEG